MVFILIAFGAAVFIGICEYIERKREERKNDIDRYWDF